MNERFVFTGELGSLAEEIRVKLQNRAATVVLSHPAKTKGLRKLDEDCLGYFAEACRSHAVCRPGGVFEFTPKSFS